MIAFEPNSTSFIILALAYILLATGLSFLWLLLIKRQLELKAENRLKRLQDEAKAQQLLEEAGVEAQKIITRAHESVMDLLTQSEVFKKEQTTMLSNKLNQIVEVYATDYKNQDLSIRQKSQEQLTQTLTSIKQTLLEELRNFQNQLTTEIEGSKKTTQDAVSQAQQAVLGEIEKYKETRLKDINRQITEVIKEVVQKILRRQIKPEDHEELVIQALEEAKQLHFFD